MLIVPFTYWGIEGLGVSLGEILPMLDAEKIRLELLRQDGNAFGETEPEFEEYLHTGNIARFDYLESDMGADGICGVIADADEKHLATSANDGDVRYFLFYPLVYPWALRESECTSEEEARQHIRDLLLRFTFPEVAAEQVLEKIDFINEVGSSN